MKAQNGGKGMSDPEVKAFITRFVLLALPHSAARSGMLTSPRLLLPSNRPPSPPNVDTCQGTSFSSSKEFTRKTQIGEVEV